MRARNKSGVTITFRLDRQDADRLELLTRQWAHTPTHSMYANQTELALRVGLRALEESAAQIKLLALRLAVSPVGSTATVEFPEEPTGETT